jgi:prepilin-type processing-associated H-X9-DG protein
VIILAVGLAGLLVCGGIIAFWTIPAMRQANQGAQQAAQRAYCTNSLKQIGIAMHNYHDTYRRFPAAVITDDEGQPMHSWRVALLPFLEASPTYEQYDFSEPWDGPNNGSLLPNRPGPFVCPSDFGVGPFDTSYVMIVGEGTLGGEPNEEVKMRDITDGTSNTILAIEVGGSGIPWMEPRDMTVEEAFTYITDPMATGQQHPHPGGVNVVLADGSVRFISSAIDPQMLRRLLTRNDGEPVGEY